MELNRSKTAVITGGASGLGAAVAQRLAAFGVNVTLFDTNLKAAQMHAKAIGGAFQVVDVSDVDSVANGFAAVKSASGGLDILVDCAGIGPAAKTVSRGLPHDPAVFAKVVGINLIGSFNCASQAAAMMLEGPADGPDGVTGGDCEYRLCRRVRGAGRTGGLCGLERRNCRDDIADGPRSGGRWGTGMYDCPWPFSDALAGWSARRCSVLARATGAISPPIGESG